MNRRLDATNPPPELPHSHPHPHSPNPFLRFHHLTLFQNPTANRNPPFPSLQSTKPRPSSHNYKIPKRKISPNLWLCTALLCGDLREKSTKLSPPLLRRMILAILEETEINPPRSMCQADNFSICHLLKCPKNIIFVRTSQVPKKLSSTKHSWGTPISTSLTGAYTRRRENPAITIAKVVDF